MLSGSADACAGYHLISVEVDDSRVVALSGEPVHKIAVAAGSSGDRVEGISFKMSEAELAASDAYEVEAYARIEVALDSGRRSRAYLARPEQRHE